MMKAENRDKPHPRCADERDITSGWRKVMGFKPGVIRRAKQRMNRRNRRRAKQRLGGLLLIALALAILAAPALARDDYPAPGWVVDAHDGDTLLVDCDLGLMRVRLRCVDAPEVASTRWPEQPGARQARDLVRHLTVGHWVALYGRSSSYGRAVRRVVLPDGRDLAEVLVSAGWAMVDTRYCRGKRLLELQERARRARRGVWGLSARPVAPWEWRRGRRQPTNREVTK